MLFKWLSDVPWRVYWSMKFGYKRKTTTWGKTKNKYPTNKDIIDTFKKNGKNNS